MRWKAQSKKKSEISVLERKTNIPMKKWGKDVHQLCANNFAVFCGFITQRYVGRNENNVYIMKELL